MSFSDAVATLPDWVRLWVLWLSIVVVAATLIALVLPGSRREGFVMLATNAAMVVSMQVLFMQVGFVRLLGLPHIVFWTPLVVFLAIRLRTGGQHPVARIALAVFVASLSVSLVLDYIDVARWLLGERAPMGGAI